MDYGIQALMIRIIINGFFVEVDKVGFESACENLSKRDRDHIINENNYSQENVFPAELYQLTGLKLTEEQRIYLAMLDL